MRSRIFFKMWLLTLIFSGVFIGALSTTSAVPKKGAGASESLKGPTTAPLKLVDIVNKKSGTELTPDPLKTLMVLATLDGTLTAVDRVSGELKWISKDEPMIRVPSGPLSTKAPYFLPDPKTGSLYVMGRHNSLKKLPFTIPQLVAMAPCRNSEGLMYTGRKLDYWLTLNPQTGEKSEMPTFAESFCPAKPEKDGSGSCSSSPEGLPGSVKKTLLIGKTEYTLSMLDGRRKWNITYHHYSSVDMTPQSSQDYELVHFTSPSTGAVLTYDRESGQLLWQRELDSPVIAVYAVDCASSNLVSVPFNPIAPETLDRLKSVSTQSNQPLSPTTYIGESNFGLYAVPALVDDMVLLMSSDGTPQLPPLLEGPSADNNDTPTEGKPGRDRDRGNSNNNSFDPQKSKETERDILLLGYYELPEPATGKLPMQIESSALENTGQGSLPALPAGQYNDSDSETEFFTPTENFSNDKLELMDPVPLTDQVTPNKVQFPPFPMPQVQPSMSHAIPEEPKQEGKFRDVKPIKIVFTTALISVVVTTTVMIVGLVIIRKVKAQRLLNKQGIIKEKTSDTEEDTPPTRKSKKSADGSIVSIGKISFYPAIALGKGCEGTFVFKGKFEDRDVAVKRILPQCFEFADREVDLLKTADQHPNVIRYFCTESDEQFRYIALELCEATLSDWIEGKFVCDSIDPIHILREATDGLAHLHALRIVHRDIKPANVLLMRSSSGNHVRTMISDFGLCKKISNGRMSFSRRSGGIPGTDGWIAPEVLRNMNKEPQRMSYSVDIFSLGCVYYFVLTNGDHPFGDDMLRRQSNIYSGDYDVEKVKENPQGLYELISQMISEDASVRPPLMDILSHPVFWSKEKVLQFFLDVSDRIEKESESCLLLRRLESDGTRIVKNDWRNHICAEVAMDLRKYRTYNGQSVRDLLRALRNKKNHYRELTTEAQASLGHIPDQFVDYWASRFPDLLPYTWLKFESVRDEPLFSKYYPKSYSFNAQINPEFDMTEQDIDDGDNNEGRLELRNTSPDKSQAKVDKNFWRSKSQFKYNKWRGQQQKNNLRENPTNFVSFGTTRYQNSEATNVRSPDTDTSWRNPLPKNKP